METQGKYYLGRVYDAERKETLQQPLLYDPDDLTTHGVVVGMTGSGKTGLCIDLLEEAALNKLPALMIDPKGDITNALLHFPDLAASDFLPWVNAEEARREGKSTEQLAADTAELWRTGLSDWDITPERIAALRNAVEFTIYTPGSDSGVPVSILASLAAPKIDWHSNKEIVRERIGSTVSALLGLIGIKDIDPVQSREHILLSNIFEIAWRDGKDLSLSDLIMQTQSPPFAKLGVFEVNAFFPEKERFGLAMLLNNMLAAPAFQSWIEGQPLDVGQLLYTPSGKPRHSVFYIAHLNDDERMFFVSLLFAAVETWMRTQKGSTSLRALLYFDEIFGYLPPVANPPSKEAMLRMLKQARAFGVGLLLATQNPVDVDYKALSNAGTWFIGRLQTDQDKQRLLDGLTGAAGGLDRAAYDNLLSRLGKRVFLLHNVHEKKPVLFQTRWAMNYLAGPLTRTQIPALNRLAGATLPATAAATVPETGTPVEGAVAARTAGLEEWLDTKPIVPGRGAEYFLPNNLSLSEAARAYGERLQADSEHLGVGYWPVLIAQAAVRYANRKYNLDHRSTQTAIVFEPDKRGMTRWEDHLVSAVNPRELDSRPMPKARFAMLGEPLNDERALRSMESDFVDWIYRKAEIKVRSNSALDIFAGPDVSEEEFRKECENESAKRMEEELDEVAEKYERQLEKVEDQLSREERELREDEEEYSRRKQEEGVSHIETLISFVGGRRRSLSSSMTKRRMTAKAKAEVEESLEAIEKYEAEIAELEKELSEAKAEVEERWEAAVGEVEEIAVQPYKKDIELELFGVGWFPYHLVLAGSRVLELPGYDAES